MLLGDSAVDSDYKECYEFIWPGKNEAIMEAAKATTNTLRPCKEESKNWETTQNLYIEGDNLEVLKLLQESYLGKVKMMYIDPPYNTGKDFVYRDNFHKKADEYKEENTERDEEENQLFQNNESNGRFHSDWCSMIYPRLKLARDLLKDDGIIFISIDYNENYNLRSIANNIFGYSNFVGEITWESKTKSQNTATAFNKLQPKTENILVFTKKDKARFNLIVKGKKEYPLSDERGCYREYPIEVMNATGIRGRESMIFEISDGVSTVYPPEGKQWKLGQAQVATYLESGDLFIRDKKAIIKMRPEYERNEETEPFWGFFSKDSGTAESAKKELYQIIPNHGFETVKPVNIIKNLIYHASDKDSTILDFFSGSATTAHACMQLNAEDGGNRKFIMVQLPELCAPDSEAAKAGYKNICEIGKERIRRAGEKIKAEHATTAPNLDIGFRVLKLDSSNMKDVFYSPDEISQDLLTSTESNIKEDRTPLDLLYSCLIDWGVDEGLSLPIKTETIDGAEVFTVNDGEIPDLITCFDENISTKAIKQIASKKPLRVVFRDSSFADSPTKINVTEIFKTISPNTTIKVL